MPEEAKGIFSHFTFSFALFSIIVLEQVTPEVCCVTMGTAEPTGEAIKLTSVIEMTTHS